jgi:predicted nucleic-acid-binding Zn-ribbon protein
MAGAGSVECPRCQGTMERGYIVDEGYGKKVVSSWASGQPERSIWTGLKLRGKEKRDVTTFRCRRCGYLESYA